MKKICVFLLFLLFATFPSFATDTLEVFVLRVQFKEEKTDNSLTTGTGLFDSGEKSENYSLDPSGRRGTVAYWRKHFEFVNHYFQAASNGKQVISFRIFPESDANAYQLDKYIIDYNRTARRDDEKVADFDEARSRDYMTFIFDAVKKAHESEHSPFKIPLSENKNTKRAYMILHAGASRLIDGGSLGTNGADTPGDFMDVFVSADYWSYLPPDSVGLAEGDSVRGLALKGAAIDTLKEVMVVSETASQDGLNWGVNGILVNQVGRALGMPNTYDVVKGISRLGYFDMMDFAGYNAGNGFFPVLPSAWLRAYMGWAKVKEVSPKNGKSITVDIAAAGTQGETEIVKVPLSANEYLLIENRQRSSSLNGGVEVFLGGDTDDSSFVSQVLLVDSLSQVFEDSICHNGKCKKNPKKAKGIVLGSSSHDAALPASGIVVWKVNEWYLRESLPYGVTNFWGGDTLRDHQFGISLVEADDILTVGKTFKNALGQDAFDYGSGTDLIPHLRVRKDSVFDTVFSIRPSGYGNTATVQGGYTGIQVKAKLPKKFRKEKNANAFMGDSVINFASPVLSVTIQFEDLSLPHADFPKAVGLNTAPRAAVLADYPSAMLNKEGERLLVFGSEDGTLQALSAYGEPLMESDTSVSHSLISNKDSIENQVLYRLGKFGKLLGLASSSNTIISLHENQVVRTELLSDLDYVRPESEKESLKEPFAGPMIVDSLAFIATKKEWLAFPLAGKWEKTWSQKLPESFEMHDMAVCKNKEKTQIVGIGSQGKIVTTSLEGTLEWLQLPSINPKGSSLKGQKFRFACSDFDRDGISEAFVLGSQGYGAFVKIGDTLSLVELPRQYDRGGLAIGLEYHETSPISVGDIQGDGLPEAVFLGHNKVYAVDFHGIPVAGFPVRFSRGQPEYEFNTDPLLIDVSGDSLPEILAPAPGGLLYAFSGKGKMVDKQFPLQAGNFEYGESKPMTILALNAIDSLKGLELYALHRNYVAAFRLPNSQMVSTNWSMPGNGNERTGWFDASVLKKPKIEENREEIDEFYMYPNPVRGGIAKSRFKIGADAENAKIEIFDITGLCVQKEKLLHPKKGMNQWDYIDVSKLGSDVYTVRLRVRFKSGKTKQKIYRLGVIR